jgi:formamidopyrimidine-DNA glycosylase
MARELHQRVAGSVITEVLVAYDKIVASELGNFERTLKGQTIRQVGRIGKWIKVDLESGGALLAHLKMTGQFIMGDWPGNKWDHWPNHARAGFLLTGPAGKEGLFYRDTRKFGRLRAFDPVELSEFLDELALGPDPLEINPVEFHLLISAKKNPLKQVLLNQQIIAGLGNIYVDESLFAALLAPKRLASDLSPQESARLLKHIKRILNQSIENRGSTVSDYQGLEGPGSFQDLHLVYGKAGKNCPVCGEILTKSRVAGRGTTHCPKCQK